MNTNDSCIQSLLRLSGCIYI